MRETPEDRFERIFRSVMVWVAWFFILFCVMVNLTSTAR